MKIYPLNYQSFWIFLRSKYRRILNLNRSCRLVILICWWFWMCRCCLTGRFQAFYWLSLMCLKEFWSRRGCSVAHLFDLFLGVLRVEVVVEQVFVCEVSFQASVHILVLSVLFA